MATNKGLTDADIDAALARAEAGESCTAVAQSLGVSPSGLSYHFRKRGRSFRLQKTMLGGLCHGCGQVFHYDALHVRRGKRRMYCSVACRTANYRGEVHWKFLDGKTTYSQAGYKIAPVPSDHVSRTSTRRKRRDRAAEHILVAESMLGRALNKGEVVHHINGLKHDNRPCNLLVCDRAYHAWLHFRMSYMFQREHYGDL